MGATSQSDSKTATWNGTNSTTKEVSTMDATKRKALEAAGWRFGDAAEFLEMTEEERQFLDARIEAALAVRRQREAVSLTQKQLANRIKTSQPRIAKIEQAAPDVTLDQILRAFMAAGGRIAVKRVRRAKSADASIEIQLSQR
jgi:ribosome-binding protein aMBF1 (putative translation factor)